MERTVNVSAILTLAMRQGTESGFYSQLFTSLKKDGYVTEAAVKALKKHKLTFETALKANSLKLEDVVMESTSGGGSVELQQLIASDRRLGELYNNVEVAKKAFNDYAKAKTYNVRQQGAWKRDDTELNWFGKEETK